MPINATKCNQMQSFFILRRRLHIQTKCNQMQPMQRNATNATKCNQCNQCNQMQPMQPNVLYTIASNPISYPSIVAVATGPWDPGSQWTLGQGPRVPMDPGPGTQGPNGPWARDPGSQWTRRSPLSSPSPHSFLPIV